jgi:hypothetical protein
MNEPFLSTKYHAYLYLCAKQGIKTLSYGAWINTHKKGNLL